MTNARHWLAVNHFCFATIWSLILAYVAAGTIFFRTSSALLLYGRPATIFFEYVAPTPGRASSSASDAVLISRRSADLLAGAVAAAASDFFAPFFSAGAAIRGIARAHTARIRSTFLFMLRNLPELSPRRNGNNVNFSSTWTLDSRVSDADLSVHTRCRAETKRARERARSQAISLRHRTMPMRRQLRRTPMPVRTRPRSTRAPVSNGPP
jgi:hypothetical protein